MLQNLSVLEKKELKHGVCTDSAWTQDVFLKGKKKLLFFEIDLLQGCLWCFIFFINESLGGTESLLCAEGCVFGGRTEGLCPKAAPCVLLGLWGPWRLSGAFWCGAAQLLLWLWEMGLASRSRGKNLRPRGVTCVPARRKQGRGKRGRRERRQKYSEKEK